MSTLDELVSVVTNTQNPGITVAGFGIPLLATPNATWPERYRSYGQPTDVAADWATTSPEYLAASAIFAQTPRPPTILIGRLANKPTMLASLALSQIGAVGTKYQVRAFVNGVSQTVAVTTAALSAWAGLHVYAPGNRVSLGGNAYQCTVGGTSAAGPGPSGTGGAIADGTVTWEYIGAVVNGTANDAIIFDLVTALNALAAPAPNFIATSTGVPGALVITCTGSALGNWFALETIGTNPAALCDLMTNLETTADPGIATDLTALLNATSEWYAPILLHKSDAIVNATAAWVEANKRLFYASSANSAIPTVADGSATDIAHVLKGLSYRRSHVDHHPRADEFLDAAAVGRWFAILPGGDNWTNKTLIGVSPVKYTATHRANMLAKNAGYYTTLGGIGVMQGKGKVAGGTYLDATRGIDQVVAWYQQDEANLLIQSEKVPYTDGGIGRVAAKMRAVHKRATLQGIIAPFPRPTVTVPALSAVPSADKSSRTLNNINAAFTLAGALDSLNVSVVVAQ